MLRYSARAASSFGSSFGTAASCTASAAVLKLRAERDSVTSAAPARSFVDPRRAEDGMRPPDTHCGSIDCDCRSTRPAAALGDASGCMAAVAARSGVLEPDVGLLAAAGAPTAEASCTASQPTQRGLGGASHAQGPAQHVAAAAAVTLWSSTFRPGRAFGCGRSATRGATWTCVQKADLQEHCRCVTGG